MFLVLTRISESGVLFTASLGSGFTVELSSVSLWWRSVDEEDAMEERLVLSRAKGFYPAHPPIRIGKRHHIHMPNQGVPIAQRNGNHHGISWLPPLPPTPSEIFGGSDDRHDIKEWRLSSEHLGMYVDCISALYLGLD